MFLTMLENVMRLPMVFFDTTPMGRILARFSTDIFAVDITIPALWDMLAMCTFSVRILLLTFIFFDVRFCVCLYDEGLSCL